MSDSGTWKCMVTTPQGNVSNNIDIVVISNKAASCESITTMTSKKGVYKWPRTIAGVMSEQPCKRGQGRVARHRCSMQNVWEKVDVKECEFIDEVTRRLEEFASLTPVCYNYLLFLYMLSMSSDNSFMSFSIKFT